MLNLSSAPSPWLRRSGSESEVLCNSTANLTNLRLPIRLAPARGPIGRRPYLFVSPTTSYQGDDVKMLFALGVCSPHGTYQLSKRMKIGASMPAKRMALLSQALTASPATQMTLPGHGEVVI